MADNIRLITWSAQTVRPVNDANVYEAALGAGGVKYGCEVTAAGGNRIHISAGNGILCGRAFEVLESDIPIQLSGSGTLQGRVYIHLDLSNTGEPIQIMTEIGSNLTPPIQQEDVNVVNGIYEINLATFTVTTLNITDIVNVAKKLRRLAKEEYFGDVTSGTRFSFDIPDYSKENIIEAYLNGLRLAPSEFTVSDTGRFQLARTLNTNGNDVQIVKWMV